MITKQTPSSSARNCLKGKVCDIFDDELNTYLTIDCGKKDLISAKITSSSYKNLKIKIGDELFAIFKAYNINIL